MAAEANDWPRWRPRPFWLFVIAVLGAIVFGGGTASSYYVEALWFESLGLAAVKIQVAA